VEWRSGGTTPSYDAVMPAKAGIHFRRSMNKQPAVYMLASKPWGSLYVGVTSELVKRV
jgi:hypothetical protein